MNDHEHPLPPKGQHERAHEGPVSKVRLVAELDLPKDADPGDVRVHAFDEEGKRLCHCGLGKKGGELELPDRLIGRMITLAFEPRPLTRANDPTLSHLIARGVPVLRVPYLGRKKPINAGRVRFDPRLFKRSCCRVRGRVIRRIRLANGTVLERPLCNARVVICEVDTSPRRIVQLLPEDLLPRLIDELKDIVAPLPLPTPAPPPIPPPPGPPPPIHTAHEGDGHAHEAAAIGAEGIHRSPGQAALLPVLSANRALLLENVHLLGRYWCRFPWLHVRYTTDCLKTVELDATGRFDTDITYLCYGDRPDLYFKVEQGCNGDWRTVHAPSVACNTRWDYCCGDEVEILVTDPTAGLGALLAPYAHAYAPDDPASVGRWDLLSHTSEVFVVHAALTRTGKVLLFSGGTERQLPLESRLWDPILDTLAAHSFQDDLFCAFQVVLPDGRVLVMGGSNYHGPHGRGILATYTFDPAAPGWTKHADMAHGRWYPTAVVLADGDVLVFSGNAAGGGVVQQVERFSAGTNSWSPLPAAANKSLAIYPSLHLMAGGNVFYSGTRWAGGSASPRPWTPPDTALFDPATNSWADVGPHVIPNRTEGTSVLLPPRASAAHHHGHGEEMPPPGTLSRVLVLGGDCGTEEGVSAEVIDLAVPAPAWTRIADMHHRRVNPNAVLLADGSVLVCAGIAGFKWDPDPGYVLEAEILDSQSLAWSRAAAMAVARQYHSISVLLPDGRVLNAGSVGGLGGGTNLTSMEVFSPPYLFRGPRPRVTGYPAAAAHGDTVELTSPDACRIRSIALVRPGAITHHTDSEPRYLPLEFARHGRCGLHAHIPEDATVLPPGYYMLFALDDAGVPSEGKFVQVG